MNMPKLLLTKCISWGNYMSVSDGREKLTFKQAGREKEAG